MQGPNAVKSTLRILQKPDHILALETFLLDREAANLSPRTLTFYRQKIAPFLDSRGHLSPTRLWRFPVPRDPRVKNFALLHREFFLAALLRMLC